MEAAESSAPSDEEVCLWGIPDRADWAKALQLRSRSLPLHRKLFRWLTILACPTLAISVVWSHPQAAFLIMLFFLMLLLRVRQMRNALINRIMAKAARSGGCPHWCFGPRGVHLRSGPNEFYYEWSTLDKIVADEELVVLVSNRYAAECVPSRFFKTPADLGHLLEFARGAGLPVVDYRKNQATTP